MLNFITFNWQKDAHVKLANQEFKDAIPVLFFTDEDATVRRGFLYTKYATYEDDDYNDEHLIHYPEYLEGLRKNINTVVKAEGAYIMPISITDKWG